MKLVFNWGNKRIFKKKFKKKDQFFYEIVNQLKLYRILFKSSRKIGQNGIGSGHNCLAHNSLDHFTNKQNPNPPSPNPTHS